MGIPGLVGITSSIVSDFEKVQRATDRKTYKFLRRFGAFVRTTARRSMRPGGKKNKVSRPFEPPRTHGGGILKNSILFEVTSNRKNVVIGPILVSGTKGSNKVAQVLEEGGTLTGFTTILDAGETGRDAFGKFVKAKKPKREQVTKRIAPRPYMGPAFHENKAKLSSIWDSVN